MVESKEVDEKEEKDDEEVKTDLAEIGSEEADEALMAEALEKYGDSEEFEELAKEKDDFEGLS